MHVATLSEQRLQNYIAAEARILSAGFSIRLAERQRQEADLAAIQKQIAVLQGVVAREQAVASGGSGSRFSQADFGGRG